MVTETMTVQKQQLIFLETLFGAFSKTNFSEVDSQAWCKYSNVHLVAI